jgi:replicative DNA helicase
VHGKSVVFYSLEMTRRQAQVRLHAALGRRLGHKVDANAMLRRTWPHADYKHLLQSIEEQVPGSVHIHEMSMGLVTPGLVNSHAGDFDLSVIDYVGLMRNDEGLPAIKDYRIIAEISNGLKATCLAKYHPIIAASQINRDGVSVRWRPPALHTLAQSDHLGNDGDVVITMKRFGKGAAVSSIEKNRHGSSGDLFFNLYDANHGDFREITKDEAEEIKDRDEDGL